MPRIQCGRIDCFFLKANCGGNYCTKSTVVLDTKGNCLDWLYARTTKDVKK